ncbi:hypothetical protein RSOL_518500 [Rhizoctonia solani AG-3 Rhs1AP]|uniref:Uncharacterized protein n=1 Tax=Rhizoctonia solani AG-3 Rhs1AP TaxID=1086054 RepID=X8JV36_9AGAM|nr:hypothetical protein RSOL_518500 [Rhizoctonia solani AG-3 Rhs1AP]
MQIRRPNLGRCTMTKLLMATTLRFDAAPSLLRPRSRSSRMWRTVLNARSTLMIHG